MHVQKLEKARAYEAETGKTISKHNRPGFHITPYTGWMNDPNGFSYFNGQYHLFYQSNPYDIVWDAMHWGHVVSDDLISWKYVPMALAPDERYDSHGCFSGSAISLPNGQHLLMYTGVRKENGPDSKDIQTQCLAIGDGVDYVKYENNPVIDESSLSDYLSQNDFRDPKIWQEKNGTYRLVVGARKKESGEGVILLFCSQDAYTWSLESTLIENDGKFGTMWECPDFFSLDNQAVLICSPMDMRPKDEEYLNGHMTLGLIGRFDETSKQFSYSHHQTLDYGMDFYAPQTMLAPDGRRILIAWMQNWNTLNQSEVNARKWFGQMTLPRELTIQNGRLYQNPIQEIETYRHEKIAYEGLKVSGEFNLEGIEGRMLDMEIRLRPESASNLYHKFTIVLAQNDDYKTTLSYRPHESSLELNRRYSGTNKYMVHDSRCVVPAKNGEIKLRIILDKYSIETFINDGEQVMTASINTDLDASGISFCAHGNLIVDIIKYEIRMTKED